MKAIARGIGWTLLALMSMALGAYMVIAVATSTAMI